LPCFRQIASNGPEDLRLAQFYIPTHFKIISRFQHGVFLGLGHLKEKKIDRPVSTVGTMFTLIIPSASFKDGEASKQANSETNGAVKAS
jgi:hypothetical protein